MNNQEWHQCNVCHNVFVRPEIEYKADPYRCGMLGEEAPVWICRTCSGKETTQLKKIQKHDHSIGVLSVEKAIMGRLKAEVKRII
jgi:hypothetical protein